MAVMSRLLPLVAYSTFAIFLLALLATPTNALADPHAHVARGHDSVAKRKRNAVKRAKRCRPQSTSLAVASSTSPAGAYTATPTATHSSVPTAKAQSVTTQITTYAPSTSKTKSSSQAVATTSAASGGGGNGVNGSSLSSNKKLCWAWPNGSYDLTSKWAGNKVAGLYTWSPAIPSNVNAVGIPGWPMFWGANQESSFAKVDGSKAGLCFTFNEPNQVGQSDMSVADAVTLWRKYVSPRRAAGCKIVSPATTSAPSGLQWLKDFKAACSDCVWDYTALHWYDVSITAFQAYVTSFHDAFGKPVMITEYACQNFNGGAQCTKDETWALHTTMAAWFDKTDWVALYCPFGAMREMQGVNAYNQLMNSDGSPNDLAYMYMG